MFGTRKRFIAARDDLKKQIADVKVTICSYLTAFSSGDETVKTELFSILDGFKKVHGIK